MTTHDTKAERDDAFLDALFDEAKAARTTVPEVSPELMACILADAEAVQDSFAPPPAQVTRPERPGLFRQISNALGGWPALAGLATASVCGLWLGISPPEGLSDMASIYVTGDETLLDPISGFDLDLGEG